MLLAVHVCTQVDAGIADGAVAAHAKELPAHALGVGDTQRNVVQPLRRLHAEGHGHIDHLRIFHGFEELGVAHPGRGSIGDHARPGGFHFHVRDRHDADPGAFVLELVDLAYDAFRKHQVRFRHLDVGQVVILALREGFIPGLAGFLLQLGFSQLENDCRACAGWECSWGAQPRRSPHQLP